MSAPQGYVALDLVGFTDKGEYAAGSTYVKNDLVHSDNKIYLSLQDNNTGQALPVSPETETAFWKLWLSGGADSLELITAKDTGNLTGGGAGTVVVAQELIDAIVEKYTELNSDLSSVSDELETVTANLSDVEAQAEAQKYSEDETDHSETVYSLFKNSISYWGNFHNLTYHFRISDNADSTFGDGHFVAYIFRDNAGAVFSAFIINKWTADAWSMIFTSYDEAKYIKKLS